jgi:hypothetical protein
MRMQMARAGVAVAAVASLGMGGGLVIAGGSPAGAATTSATGGGQPGQTIDEIVANTGALYSSEVVPLLDLATSAACLVVAIASGNVLPPYPPPGGSCLGG